MTLGSLAVRENDKAYFLLASSIIRLLELIIGTPNDCDSMLSADGVQVKACLFYPLPSTPHIILSRRVWKKMWLVRFTTFIL